MIPYTLFESDVSFSSRFRAPAEAPACQPPVRCVKAASLPII